jgi:acetyltransferase
MNEALSKFFYPESICIVGASTKEKSIGYELLKSMLNYGYTGKIFPVNPKADEALGLKCYSSISGIDEKIDLAVIVVAKQFVEQAVDDLLNKNVKSIALITAGFKEIGEEGIELENKVLARIKKNNARMIGPNCMGVISTLENIKLNATFVAEKPGTGSMAFLSQSGALGAAVINSLRDTDIKFAHFVSVGNKADLNENDFLKFWQCDDNIRITAFYLESFENGLGFLTRFMNSTVTKPAIILKAGRTAAGMKAANSHTGALSSEDRIVEALLEQFGIIRANNLNEMFNTAKGFENFPAPKGNRVAVVTNAGGPAILTVDALEKEGLTLAGLEKDTKFKLRKIVHPEGSINNPVDLLPGGNADTYKKIIELTLTDVNVDAVISIFVEPVMVEPLGVVEAVNSVVSGKPVMQVVMPLPEFRQKYRIESKYNKPIFRNPEDPAEVISNMLFQSESSQRLSEDFNEYNALLNVKSKSLKYKNGFLDQACVNELTAEYNIPLCSSIIVSIEHISEVDDIDYPVVLKCLGKNIVHKSELGAVKVNIKNKEELLKAADLMNGALSAKGIEIDKFYIQDYIIAEHELLVGGFRDVSFGPVIMFGSGGKYVEVFKDNAIKSAYASEFDLKNLIDRTKIGQILKGVRGDKTVDLDELIMLLKNCCRMLIENNNIKEFDINPLIVTGRYELKAVDVRIKIENSL